MDTKSTTTVFRSFAELILVFKGLRNLRHGIECCPEEMFGRIVWDQKLHV